MITSTSNSKIKFYRKLKSKKFRDETQLFLIEGPKIISDAFDSHWIFEHVFFSPELVKDDFSRNLIKNLQQSQIDCSEVNADVFRTISIKDGPKGIAAILKQKYNIFDDIESMGGLWIGLDRIQDPGNLGSIMRTLDAVGGQGIILIDHCTDPFDIASVRGSMGAIFTTKIIKTTGEEFTNYITNNPIPVYGTSDKAKIDYQSTVYESDLILLMGSEREGLSIQLLDLCDQLLCIPMVGKSDSLNLAVATSICAYEIFNQSRKRMISL